VRDKQSPEAVVFVLAVAGERSTDARLRPHSESRIDRAICTTAVEASLPELLWRFARRLMQIGTPL